MKIGFLFPGQGAQTPGMGKDFFESFPIARCTFEEADDLLAFPLSKILFEGSETELKETRTSQLALFVHSMTLLRTLLDHSPVTPALCAGLSLGEYTALCASGMLSFAETLHLVRIRAELMSDACRKNRGTMCAVLGCSVSQLEQAVRSLDQVWIANYNSPRQTVLSGTKEGIEAAMPMLKSLGAKRILMLQVDGGFHSPLMQPAQEGLAPFIAEAPLSSGSVPLVMNVSGKIVEGSDAVKAHLTRQMTHPVRWEQGIRSMQEFGISLYLEIGCGTVLKGLNTTIVPDATTLSLSKVSDLEAIFQHLNNRIGSCS